MELSTTWTQRLPTPRDEHVFFCLRTRAGLLLQRLSILRDAKETKDPVFTRLGTLLEFSLTELLDDTSVRDVLLRWQNYLTAAESLFTEKTAQMSANDSPFYQQWIAWTAEQGRLFAREQWDALDRNERTRLDLLVNTLSHTPYPPLEILRRSRHEVSLRLESAWAFAWLEGYFLELQPRCRVNEWASSGLMRVTLA